MSTAKKAAAQKAVSMVEPGMVVGLGTGSTAYWAIQQLGQQGLEIKAVASSIASEDEARKVGITIVSFESISSIDIYIDGADKVDSNRNLIKGGGGALLREKILAFNSKQFVVIVDDTKLVESLGKFHLPVEVIQFAQPLTLNQIETLGCKPSLRLKNDKPFITDNGNYIIDCDFKSIANVEKLNTQLHSIPGVVETGLFINTMVAKVIIGKEDETVQLL